MPGIAGDGSEDLPTISGRELTARSLCPEVPPQWPAGNYLSQKLANAYGELKILTDNVQLMDERHMKRLIEINSMVGSLVSQLQAELEETHGK